MSLCSGRQVVLHLYAYLNSRPRIQYLTISLRAVILQCHIKKHTHTHTLTHTTAVVVSCFISAPTCIRGFNERPYTPPECVHKISLYIIVQSMSHYSGRRVVFHFYAYLHSRLQREALHAAVSAVVSPEHPQRVVIYGRLPYNEYMASMESHDMFLDPYHYGGTYAITVFFLFSFCVFCFVL
jgi:hypothetical protein